jgi:hypothetical protein
VTNIVAIIRDPSGNIYANALVIASFVGQNTTPGAGPYLLGGLPTGQFELVVPGETDSSGNYAISLPGADVIQPTPSQWKFSVVSNTAPTVSFSTLITITGPTQDISAALQAAAAPLFPGTSFSNVGTLSFTEQAAPAGAAGKDVLYGDSTAHRLRVINNNGAVASLATLGDTLGVFAATTSAQLASVISDETGTGPLVFATGSAIAPASSNGLAVVYADQFASVQAAINALPAGGGVVDARSPNVNLTLGAIDTGSNTNIVTLLLGPFTYTFTQITVRQGFNILGAGFLNTTLSNVGTNANPAFVIPQVNNNAITIHWSDFQVLGLAGNTSQDGIFFDASTLTNAGVELSTFTNIQLTGFNGSPIHLKATQDSVSGSIGAIQGLTFINVTAIRPTGATGATQHSLRIEGGCGQIDFINCWFTGQSSDTGTNVFVGTTGIQAPYSIHFHNTTNQNGFAYLFDGAIGVTTEYDHFEVIKGCYNFANTGSPIVGFKSTSAYVNSNVAVNAGNGYIANVPNTAPSTDVLIESPMIGGTPDKTIVNAANGANIRMLNAQYVPGNTPVNVSVSSGVTYQGTPAATLDIRCAKTVQLSASATAITTLKSGLQPGERVTFYTTGGSAVFATGGNLSLGSQASPLIVNAGDSVTFMRVDAGAAAFVLMAYSQQGTLLNSQGALAAVTGTGADNPLYQFTIPANTIQAGKGFRIRAQALSNNAVLCTYKFIIGATTVTTLANSSAVESDTFTLEVFNTAGVQNAQDGIIQALLNTTNVGSSITSAENFANAVTVKLTANEAGPNTTTPKKWFVELIK